MTTRKLLPLFLAGVVFVTALFLMQPPPPRQVVTATRFLPAGHTLTARDLHVLELPAASVPPEAFEAPAALLGETLRVDRTAGDLLLPSHLGGEALTLAPDERAVAVEVTDAAGLAGLLRPGDHVGVTAVVLQQSGTFAKVIAENLRVLYLSPDFEALDPAVLLPEEDAGLVAGGTSVQREPTGVVILAVPIDLMGVPYEFSPYGVASSTRLINVVDLLPALEHAREVELSLFLQPEQAQPFTTAGVYVPDLVITPGPSPTPTVTPTPTHTPAGTPAP
jgi:pilus assembly protein CpaB